jgi:hypothetical protein
MRQTVHKVIGAAFWLLTAALWVELWVEGKTSLAAFQSTGIRLAILAGTVLAITTWWVRHNVGIYRRKGPRSGRPEHLPRIDEDRLGRELRWRLAGGHVGARTTRHLVIEHDDDTKSYRRGSLRR